MKLFQALARAARVTLFVGLAHAATSVQAALIVQESFNYAPVGSDLAGKNGGTGFSGAWLGGAFNTGTSANYDIADSNPLAATMGNYVSATAAFSGLTRDLASSLEGNGSVYYLSFLIRPDGTVTSNSFFGMTLGNSRFANEVFVGKPGGGSTNQYVLEDRGGANQVASGVNLAAGDTALLVVKLAFGAVGSQFSLYVDPLAGGEPAVADAVKSNGSLSRVAYLGLYSGGAYSVDEIRIGTTYADVVPPGTAPEPGTLALLGLGLAGLAAARRRKQ